MKILLSVFVLLFGIQFVAQEKATKEKTEAEKSEEKRIALLAKFNKYKEVIASIDTNMGVIKISLDGKHAPLTVDNFIGLAEGTKEFIDTKDPQLEKVKRPFYNGLTFHRIAPNFVIQGGCPDGNGKGGPGYTFNDEISPALNFDRKGIVAMANAGSNTNGSQFFITLAPAKFLEGKYSIFGRVKEGMDVVEKIGKLDTFPNEKPKKKVIMNSITIEWVNR